MDKNIKYFILITSLLICVFSLFSIPSERVENNLSFPYADSEIALPEDTGTIYPVRKTQINNYEDITRKTPIDLRDPSNVQTQVEYDVTHNVYLFKTKIDNDEWITPFTLNPQQYLDYSLKESMSRYFKEKNDETFANKDKKDGFSLKDIRVNMSNLERIFGPGGVQVKTQGYVELSMGIKNTKTDNPTLSQRNRNRTMFDFDEKIQVNVDASVGDKVNFGLNYDTQSTFDFDSKRAKLAYEGKEDEIIRYLEAGNISMNTTNSLITGASSLFGVRADLQFGKLRINTVISQKETQSQTANSSGGVQTTTFEFKANAYDENQHFFLSQYFRDNFDYGMSKLPYIQSSILINKIEVWVTNVQGNFDNARNLVAFSDLGEYDKIGNSKWSKQGRLNIPYNAANNLYTTINSSYSGARDKDQVSTVLTGAGLENGQDFEKLENARKLESSEYTFNAQLGYISLNSSLNSDQVLAVAFEYTKGGETYKVGEFASEIPSQLGSATKSGAIFVKLLKPVALYPTSYTWDLMMKNVYKLGSTQIQKDKFRLNISYQSDTVGTYTNYIPEGNIKNELLLRVMNLDRLNSSNNTNPDGIFDFLEGYTINAERGRIIFPVVEPFGEHLRKKIGNNAIADKYVYQELYDSTMTVAEQIAEKNKFRISGSYRASASSSSVISLNAMNVAKGSVTVTANGTPLTENLDYTVDYIAGTVTIINQSLIDTGTPISVSLEDQSLYSMQRQTLLGLNLSYDFTKNFNVGATILHMYEKPLTYKTSVGEEALKNTVWGLNTSYRTQSQWLTNLIDKLPFVNATAPSEISLNAEFAQMIPGHYENQYTGGYSYLDDFESAKTRISLINAYGWKLAATPFDNSSSALFPESQLTNDITYGNNRAHLAWFNIDNLFTRKSSSLTPSHITSNDKSDPYVREIGIEEIYPGKDVLSTESSAITALNLSYYPIQRGPYNLDATNINSEGELLTPEKRWGGITRKLDNTNFESSNIEYIEFWLLDPFIYNDTAIVKNTGGDLYFNLGEISEDVLKDGKKFFENGLPTDPNSTDYATTTWGRVPTRQSTAYAFDNTLSDDARARQDVGFNGLSTADELLFPTYVSYLNALESKLSSSALSRMKQDPFSPFNDPGGDNYHYYRGSDYDRDKVGILDRYKYFNGTERNSITDSNESYSTAASAVPDVEDLNQDYTMNESENYYQYKVTLDPDRMAVGSNYISEVREVNVRLANGETTTNKWYQFKVPINDYNKKVGNIQGFKTVRFMRMFLTNFKKETFLRFATLDLVRGEWKTYGQVLDDGVNQGQGTINASAVNIEENGNKTPVNYVVPPGVKRIVDSNQSQLVQDNEQALALQVLNLEPNDARAVYKNTVYDLRRYKRIQMFTHAEEIIGGTDLSKNEISVFLRLGSDYKNNYYEYEIPLSITPAGKYNTNNTNDQEIVWPQENMFDFTLKLLTNLKLERNKEKRKAGSSTSYTTLYTINDPDNQQNTVSIIGNPSLSDIQVMMIGIRNKSRTVKSAEVWVNELRLTDFDEEGGWAAQGNLNIKLSDIGSVSFTGRKETIGFGSIDQSLNERRSDDYSSYTIATNLDFGRFLPEKAKASIPFYYSYSNQTTTPKYDPLDQDITLDESLSLVSTKAEKDSIKNLAQDKTTTKSLSFSNVKFDIKSKTPMPYDPANFTFGYAYSETEVTNPTTVYDVSKNYKASLNYSYSPTGGKWEPFKNLESKAPLAKYPKSLSINLLPSNISFNSYITRFYTETLTRDLESYTLGGNNSNNEFLSWNQEFYWDRDFSINWDLLPNLKISLQTGTRAEIEEPYLQVNKKLNRDDYEIWRDSVMRSIRNLGDPLSYKQAAKVTYTFPFNNIPFLNWINSSANYDSQYTWDRGAEVDSVEVGNIITNNITFSSNNRFDMTTLYNKSPFLRKANEKFGSNNRRPSTQRRQTNPVRLKRFNQEVALNPDSATVVSHGLNSKNIDVVARRDGRIIKIKYKRIDENNIRINLKDTANIQLSISQKGDIEETTLYKVAQYAARGVMSLRSFSINYSARNETAISGFRPSIGDAFGQKRTEYGITPGLDFAFGFKGGEEYLDRALHNDWLVLDENNVSPAVYNSIRKLDIEAQLEPVRGFKIRLTALREKNDRTSYQYYNYPSSTIKTLGGSFTMTTISLSSSFDSGNSKNGYHSKAFEKFRQNRDVIAYRLEQQYNGITYPNTGFIASSGLGGNQYQTGTGENVNINSSDVLIPAFIAAYTGRNVNSVSLNPFMALSSILPNWRITYDGLTTLPWFKDKFKNLVISHGYVSQYSIGSYNSFSSWIDAGNGLGFIKNLDDTPMPAPSSIYDISAVSLIEQFNPLFGAEGTMNNNLTIKARYNYTRSLNLSISSFQIVENLQKDLIIGAGYRINEFNKIMGWNKKKQSGFNNDLLLNVDLSRRTTQSLIRKIEDGFTEATSGTTIFTLKFSADYSLSKALVMRAYFDRIVNSPLISTSSYPTANTNFGVSLRFTLGD
ncbi:T9SS outer membrane translocon Sov/SprA [Dysgonomonas macrotermitis]|uniref:Cell surface protein SprA n=1 Tax=Dysgonomonas macrotermitis TaxID=1346286 RepID=A0A1M4URI0_9BACT|nr:cell surface protein SprA [Dysgonomonas macrotermitis]SHE59289.1 cell surface protein SprA [Dysgonomonas macrotermitis]